MNQLSTLNRLMPTQNKNSSQSRITTLRGPRPWPSWPVP